MELQVFENTEFGKVRAVELNDDPWFVGTDVAEILGYKNPNEAIQDHVDDYDKFLRSSKGSEMLKLFSSVKEIQEKLGRQDNWFINESGIYSLVFRSTLPKAKEFRRWVTSEVLPSIRKHGAYMTPEKIEEVLLNPDTMIKLCTQLKEEQAKRREAEKQIEEARPKVLFADAVSVSSTNILVGDLAKILKQNGIEIGQKRLFKWLRDNGYLSKRNGMEWNMPTQKAMGMGLFCIKETVINHADGHTSINKTPKVTGKGQIYFVNKFLSMQEAHTA